ncbi:MAG: zinc-binding dehydrogenase [Lachnospiraceae bacterium]|nr:zinc-binding dehydrogenase [Lachnospiraceae bacterium]
MQTKGLRMYAADDVRLEEFELPEMKEDEILIKIICDSVCMSTYKTVKQGERHKRVPSGISENPVIIGHEFAGDIIKVGSKWKDQFQPGDRFAQQPQIPGQLKTPGYSYPYYGGDTQYAIVPNEIIEKGCFLHNEGSYFEASIAEPVACCVAGFHTMFHSIPESYEHAYGNKPNGNLIIMGGCGPMGLAAISYALCTENKPKRVVVTDINDDRLTRAAQVIPVEEAHKKGIQLLYINTASMENQVEELIDLTDGHGYDDVFVFAPVQSMAEVGDQILADDGCLNIFAGPADSQFSGEVNLYNVHYSKHHYVGCTGSLVSDLQEVVEKASKGLMKPAVMITHIGGINAARDTTINLPSIPGGKKLLYMQIELPLTAIQDFRELGKTNSLFEKLADSCDAHNGLWNAEAEEILLKHFEK